MIEKGFLCKETFLKKLSGSCGVHVITDVIFQAWFDSRLEPVSLNRD